MSHEPRKQRLSDLLREMQGEISLRAFARKMRINYASLSAYMHGDSYPETQNLEKIARAKSWTLEELKAYLEDRQLEPTKPIEEVLREVRTMSAEDATKVAEVALHRIAEAAGVYKLEDD